MFRSFVKLESSGHLVSVGLDGAGEKVHALGQIFDGAERDFHVSRAQDEAGREGIERDGFNVPTHQGAHLSTGDLGLFAPDLFEEKCCILGVTDSFQEGRKGFTVDQSGGSDLDSRKHFEQLLGGPGLKFEQHFEIAPVVVGAD